jgi:hypothetical protein
VNNIVDIGVTYMSATCSISNLKGQTFEIWRSISVEIQLRGCGRLAG